MSFLSRRNFIKTSAITAGTPLAGDERTVQKIASKQSDRDYWIAVLIRLAHPVLSSLSQKKLKATMPVEAPHNNVSDRAQYTYLEALGRLLAGIAPWLESGDSTASEGEFRKRYCELARQAITAAVDPSSPDYMNFTTGSQPVVDAAFLALGVLRAPKELWEKLDRNTQRQLVEALRSTRVIRPGFNNWLLFSATIEAFLCYAGEQWDAMRVDYAIRQHEEWYKGDGVYGDGPQFHWDYYNSFVIHPMLIEVIETVSRRWKAWEALEPAILTRAQRYAAIQERLIGPDGSYPAIGRSLAYRFGAFHLLATMALRRQLPTGVKPEQVRMALTAVIRRMIEAPGTFDEHGWLTVGFCGHQPSIGETYISTGSLYLCSTGLLPLGLPRTDPFWSAAPQPWTSQKIWNGQDVPTDHAI
ncbi:MAG: DUF2264 domain-containing protein [Acidobacteriota bacterium]|nr:DUF2264 domain-containing protein [Acidobacteriota bacterium]